MGHRTLADLSAKEPSREAVARLFHEHNDSLIRFLAHKLRSWQEAREVAQEAYVRLLNLDKPDTSSFLRAFLFKTASNIAVDRLRHRQRCPHVNDAELFENLEDARTAEDWVSGEQELNILAGLVDELPPKCRRAFLLHRLEGMPISNIAVQMQLSPRQVRDYVLRGLLYCRAGLARATCTGPRL